MTGSSKVIQTANLMAQASGGDSTTADGGWRDRSQEGDPVVHNAPHAHQIQTPSKTPASAEVWASHAEGNAVQAPAGDRSRLPSPCHAGRTRNGFGGGGSTSRESETAGRTRAANDSGRP